MEREGFSVVALDGSYSAIRRVGGGVVADAMQLPFRDQCFDAVVDIVCVAHNTIDDIHLIVKEISRVLKPGGKVLSALPAIGHEAYEDKGPITYFSLYAATNLYTSDFDDIRVDWTNTCEGDTYTKLWFVKAKSKEKV